MKIKEKNIYKTAAENEILLLYHHIEQVLAAFKNDNSFLVTVPFSIRTGIYEDLSFEIPVRINGENLDYKRYLAMAKDHIEENKNKKKEFLRLEMAFERDALSVHTSRFLLRKAIAELEAKQKETEENVSLKDRERGAKVKRLLEAHILL